MCSLQSELTFTYTLTGFSNAAHDSRVFSSTQFYHHPENFFSPGQYLLADSRFINYAVCICVDSVILTGLEVPCWHQCHHGPEDATCKRRSKAVLNATYDDEPSGRLFKFPNCREAGGSYSTAWEVLPTIHKLLKYIFGSKRCTGFR